MSSDWDKFKLLLRKNFIIQSRSKLQTALEVLIPVAFCSVLVIIRSLVDIKRYDNPIYYKGLQMDNLSYLEWVPESLKWKNIKDSFFNPRRQNDVLKLNWTVLYSPKNPVLEEFVTEALSTIKTNKTITIEGKINSTELYLSLLTSKVITGIVFNDTLMVYYTNTDDYYWFYGKWHTCW